MSLREKAAKLIAPGLVTREELRGVVEEEVSRIKASLPVTANYDPKNEGYRRSAGGAFVRDLYAIQQDRMFEIAYYMYDHSAMTRRLATMDKGFLFGEPVSVTSENDQVQEILDRFWEDQENLMEINFPEYAMWLGLLGEQCWPVEVSPHNGQVVLGYVDPSQIKQVNVSVTNVRQVQQVELRGMAGRPGKKMAVIRKDRDPRSRTYDKLVGECFFFAINHPPNSPRGRSDFLTLFDWIDGLERYGYNFLDRAEFMLNFVWDVLLKGMDEGQIRKWLQENPPPEPGSLRAHNENAEWKAVAPNLQAWDFAKGFDMGKSFILGSHGRPDSWFGGGGKAYQTEAEQFGQVPIKDLDQRQLYLKHVLTTVCQFVVDQAVIAGRLSEQAAEEGFTVEMPEISKKDLTKMVNGIPQLATALSIAEERGWVAKEDAVRIFAAIVGQMGIEIDPDAAPGTERGEEGTEDYEGKEALVREVMERLRREGSRQDVASTGDRNE